MSDIRGFDRAQAEYESQNGEDETEPGHRECHECMSFYLNKRFDIFHLTKKSYGLCACKHKIVRAREDATDCEVFN
jgi:hypothetical protein